MKEEHVECRKEEKIDVLKEHFDSYNEMKYAEYKYKISKIKLDDLDDDKIPNLKKIPLSNNSKMV